MSKKIIRPINDKSIIDNLSKEAKFSIDDVDMIKDEINNIFQEENIEPTQRKLNRLLNLIAGKLEAKTSENSVITNFIESYFSVIVVSALLGTLPDAIDSIIIFILLAVVALMHAFFLGQNQNKHLIEHYNLIYIGTAIEELLDENSSSSKSEKIKDEVELKEKVERTNEFVTDYNQILIDILEGLDKDNTLYNLDEIVDLLIKNLNLSNGYKILLNSKIKRSKYTDEINKKELEKELRFAMRRMLSILYNKKETDVLLIDQVLKMSKEIQLLRFS